MSPRSEPISDEEGYLYKILSFNVFVFWFGVSALFTWLVGPYFSTWQIDLLVAVSGGTIGGFVGWVLTVSAVGLSVGI